MARSRGAGRSATSSRRPQPRVRSSRRAAAPDRWQDEPRAGRRPAAPAAAPSSQTFGDELAHVLDGQSLLGADHLAAEVDHRQAERTRGRDRAGAGRQQLFDADDVDALLRFDLHPHVAAASAAAEAALTRPRRVDYAQTGDGGGNPARRIRDLVVAAEIARVVEDHAARQRLDRLDAPAPHELVDDLRVVQDLVRAAELRELILDGVEAVRAV